MDVKRASTAIDEILECINAVADANNTLYAKSKQRLQHISQVCESITSAVKCILGEAATSQPTNNMLSELLALRKDVEMLKANMQNATALELEPVHNEEIEVVSESSIEVTEQLVSVKNEHQQTCTTKLAPESMKQLVSQYGHVLKLAAVTDQHTIVTNDCAKLLWRWFEARIYTKYPNAPPFHYGAHRLRTIVQALVLTYCYHFEHGSIDVFLRYFEDWLNSLSQSAESNKWIAPYSVYTVERKLTSEYATLTAVVVWDVLLSNGLQALCNDNNEYFLHETDMWDLVSKANIDVLDNYVDYHENPAILESLNTAYNATTL